MPITLYDLAGADAGLRFSPYCWRTKMALLHKGLDFETVPWRFTDKDMLAPTGQGRVPAILDKGRWVNDSWAIALYLDEAYPDRPPLFPDEASKAQARFLNAWADTLFMPLRPIAVRDVYAVVAEKDRAYFKETREKLLGPFDELPDDRAGSVAAFQALLKPAELALSEHAFLNGAAPGYGDYALYGTLRWPETVCPETTLLPGSAVERWYQRLSGLYGGYGAKAPTVRSLAGQVRKS